MTKFITAPPPQKRFLLAQPQLKFLKEMLYWFIYLVLEVGLPLLLCLPLQISTTITP